MKPPSRWGEGDHCVVPQYKRDKLMDDYEVVPDRKFIGWRGQWECGWQGQLWQRAPSGIGSAAS
jgi:hypothetical protein